MKDGISLCTLIVAGETYAIDSVKVCEVLEGCSVQRMPLAPAYIGGVIPHRGEVLTMVSLRALLGLGELIEGSAILVLEDGDERFGLIADSVGNVVMVGAQALEANPSTLSSRRRALFDGVYKLPVGLMARLEVAKLCPSRLKDVALFGREDERSRNARVDCG